jgi:adenine-specific DNA methylase
LNCEAYVKTRYQGSKRRLLPWIFNQIEDLKYKSVLDAFSGTCCVAYEFKRRNKYVICNDYLKSNYYIAFAIIENNSEFLTDNDIINILSCNKDVKYPTLIQDKFRDIYYTNEENAWLDMIVTNIFQMENEYRKALALYALFQSCLIKRPFNLFHRRNLYLRSTNVQRTFHNNKTWERPFEEYFKRFSQEANKLVFNNGYDNKALNSDALEIEPTNCDLVYIDPPYISHNGRGIDYHHLYHFLEGICDYNHWSELIEPKSKHMRLKRRQNLFGKKGTIENAFLSLFEKFQDNILVVSYRSPSFPSELKIKELLETYKRKVEIQRISLNYVLSNFDNNYEVLLIGQ